MPDLYAEYRHLLTGDESIGALDGLLALIPRIASSKASSKGKWISVLPENAALTSKLKKTMSSRLQKVLWLLEEAPRGVERTFSTIPSQQYSLLMDSLLLLFHQAYFVLLPEIAEGRDHLLDGLSHFADRLPRTQDRFQAKGLVSIERGELDDAIEYFRTALAATHSDEHDFVTRVQLMWTELLESGRYIEAVDVLLDVYPRVSRSDLEELTAMLRQTFRLLSPPVKKSKKRLVTN